MYRLISSRRLPDKLVIELKRGLRREVVPPLIVVAVLLFLFFSVFFGPLVFVPVCFALAYFYYASRIRVFLCYDAAVLRVVHVYDLVLTQRQRQRIYNRADVPPPVTWIHASPPYIRNSHNSRIRYGKYNDWVFRFETRFPFQLRKTRGVICFHQTEVEMLTLQKTIDEFLVETPYDKTLFEQTEAALGLQSTTRKTLVKSQVVREQKRDAAKFDSVKRYAFDRGETAIRRGDEPVAKGESAAKKKRSRNKSYDLRRYSMVKVEEEISADLTQGTLKLVATSGGFLSSCMATLSVLLFYTGLFTLIIGGSVFLTMQIWYWDKLEHYLVPQVEERMIAPLPEEVREPMANALDWYIDASRGGEYQYVAVANTFGIWLVLLLIYIVLSRFLRWPFWRRWTVILKNILPHERCVALFSWRNDRTHIRESEKKFSFFFRVIPASRKTNRLLTGKRRFSRNPGWRQPHQVVLITAEGSFPLPCGDAIEQDEIIDRINRFMCEKEM